MQTRAEQTRFSEPGDDASFILWILGAGSLIRTVRCDMKLHSLLLGWSDPDQVLRVAAGIPGKRASDGLRPSGHYCQRCEAFLTKYRTWEPQSGVGLELEDMVKTN